MIKKLLKLLPAETRKNLFVMKQKYLYDFAMKSYSHEGEDMILNKYFEHKTNGFYVDIGAHHPKRFSNTHIFYKRGWRGINIDAMPGSMKSFKHQRPRDVNLEIGISKKEGSLTFYSFNEPALNGFSKELSEERIREGVYKLKEKVEVKTYPLRDILAKYSNQFSSIDFMNIDVEGLDEQVLISNDWDRFKPEFVLFEHFGFKIEHLETDPTFILLKNAGYAFEAKTMNTLFFKRQ